MKLQRQGVVMPKGFDLKKSCIEYSKDLSWEMYLCNKTSVRTESVNYTVSKKFVNQEENFGRYFDDKNLKIKFSRIAAQLIELDGLCKFKHKSIMEYFIALMIYDDLIFLQQEGQELEFKLMVGEILLGKKYLIEEETDVFRFVLDMIEENIVLKENKDELSGIETCIYDIFTKVFKEKTSILSGNTKTQENYEALLKKIWENLSFLVIFMPKIVAKIKASNDIDKAWDN